MSSFAVGLLGAAVLYVLCVPVFHRLRRRLGPDGAASLTLVFAVVAIAIPVMWIVALVADQAPTMLRRAQDSDALARLGQLRVGSIDVGAEVAKASGTFFRWLSQQAF
ncbi:MAG: AI-2E family transporter, partial [Gemmatimonadetes bacterium]|nr:AI-2E family transporter [Gemmatimonadota bacterium]